MKWFERALGEWNVKNRWWIIFSTIVILAVTASGVRFLTINNYTRRYFDQCGNEREPVRLTLTTSGRAMLFTTVILGAGFFILLFAELSSTVNFGIITGFTICMALLADFLLAPAMMVLLTKKKAIL